MQISYLGILVLMIASPIPPEVFMPLAGIMVARSKLNFIGVVSIGVVGFLLSTMPWYLVGRSLGGQQFLHRFQKQNRWFKKIPAARFIKVSYWFKGHGKHTLLFAILIALYQRSLCVS
ncbi:hypothetical protein NDI52_21650 [Leptolyngbya sp. PL-A3]